MAQVMFAELPLPLRRLWQSTAGRVGLGLTLVLVFLGLFAPILHPYNPATDRNYALRLLAPTLARWFGTDALGRDLFTLVWYGIRTSLLISGVSVGLGLGIGVGLGLLAGYYRGLIEAGINWLTTILLAFPSILLAIALVTVRGAGLQSTIMAIALVQVPIFIRLTRSMVLSLREQEFVMAAAALGASPYQILRRHILPASLAPIIVQATLAIGTATLEAAGLGFLGLGAQPPTPELGTILADALKGGYALTKPWTIFFPGLVITLMVLAFNLLGDGLRDAFDPRSDQQIGP